MVPFENLRMNSIHQPTKTKYIIASFVCMLHFFFCYASTEISPFDFTERTPKYEVRAMWITTIGGLDWPHNYARTPSSIERQKAELCSILDKLKAANINMVLLQTRVRGTVIYPSEIEPWDGCMSGKPGVSPGYDPLEFAIIECHKRGMQLHAWVVCIPIGKNNLEGVRHMKRVHPELYVRIKNHGFMRPEKEGTADYIASICEEITRNYDIDGIHLDYIRYPEEGRLPGSIDFKRTNITRIVERVSKTVKSHKPWVMLSCSPIGKFKDLPRASSIGWNAYNAVAQDAQGWLKSGLMDALFPMMYFQGNQFYPFAADWKENSCDKIIAPGLGVYFMSPTEKNWQVGTITREMHVLRQLGLGHAYFRSKFFTDDVKGIYKKTKNLIDQYPSLIPAMKWMHKDPPESPSTINITSTSNIDNISWSGAVNKNDSPYLLYNVYCSSSSPVDIGKAENLIATRLQETSIDFPRSDNQERYYVVTAVDRYGNESNPIVAKTKPLSSSNLQMFSNDGKIMKQPAKDKCIDADQLLIKDMVGKIVTTMYWDENDPYAGHIYALKDGLYQVYTLNHKGIHHRLGFLKIKRGE